MDGIDKEIIWHNGFRMFNLPITASRRKISRKFDKIEGMVNLGNKTPHESLPVDDNPAFPITPAPNFLNYQAANNRLNLPRSRFIDEIFWFWPADLDNKKDETITALKNSDAAGALSIWKSSSASNATHNLAVYNHVLAVDYEMANNTSSSESYWRESLKYWSIVLASSDFKALALKRIEQLNDPTIKEDYLDEIFNELPAAILSINAKFAKEYYSRNETSKFEMHLKLIKNSDFDEKAKNEALDDIFDMLYNSVSEKYNKFDEGVYETPEDISKIDGFLDSIRDEVDLLKTHFGDRSNFQLLGDTIALSVKGAYVRVVNKTMETEDVGKVLSIDYKAMSKRFDEIESLAYTENARSNIKENHKTVEEIAELAANNSGASISTGTTTSSSSDSEDAVINKIGKFVTNISNMSMSDAKSYAREVENDLANLSGNHDNISNLFAMSLNAFFNTKARGALEGDVGEFVVGMNDLMGLLKIAEVYATEDKAKKDIRENIDFLKELGATEPGRHQKPSKGSAGTTTSSYTPSSTTTTTTTKSSGGGSNLSTILGCLFWIIIIIVALFFFGVIKF